MTRILIADDHAIVRKGLKEALAEQLEELSFGEAQNAQETIELVSKKKWDVLLLDINMEGRSGLEVLEEIHKIAPKLPVLMLTMYPEEVFAVRAIRAGAAGYVNKKSAPEELIGAIKKVLAGGRYVSASLAERLAGELNRADSGLPHESLSNRELQVLRLVASGKSLKEIAGELSLSVKTVGTYHIRILQKLGMHSDVEITRYAMQNKLVD